MESKKEMIKPPPSTAPEPQSTEKKSKKPIIAGILLLVGSIISIAYTSFIFFETPGLVEQAEKSGQKLEGQHIIEATQICFGILTILALLALVGGIMALRRKMWGVALIGSILGLLTSSYLLTCIRTSMGISGLFFRFNPLHISTISSLVALILIAISRKEFITPDFLTLSDFW